MVFNTVPFNFIFILEKLKKVINNSTRSVNRKKGATGRFETVNQLIATIKEKNISKDISLNTFASTTNDPLHVFAVTVQS